MYTHTITITIKQPGERIADLCKSHPDEQTDKSKNDPVEHEHDVRVLMNDIMASLHEEPIITRNPPTRDFKRGNVSAGVVYSVERG